MVLYCILYVLLGYGVAEKVKGVPNQLPFEQLTTLTADFPKPWTFQREQEKFSEPLSV